MLRYEETILFIGKIVKGIGMLIALPGLLIIFIYECIENSLADWEQYGHIRERLHNSGIRKLE